MTQRSFLWILGLSLAAALLLALPAQAKLVLTIDDIGVGAGPEVIVADNEPFGTLTAAGLTTHSDVGIGMGFVSYFGPVASFSFVNAGGASKPLSNTPTRAVLDLAGSATSAGAARLVVSLTDTDYALATQPGTHELLYEVTGNTPGSVTARTTLDPSNAEFGPGSAAVVLTPLTGGFGADGTVPAPVGPGPFSLSEQVRIVHSAAGVTNYIATTYVELPCPCFDADGPPPTFCFDQHAPSLNSWAYTFPGSFLQVTHFWCRDNGLFQLITPSEATACDAKLHKRCNPDPN